MEWGDGAGSKNAEPCSTAAVGRGTIAEAILLGRAMQWGKGENLFFLPLTSSALSTARCGWKPTDNLQLSLIHISEPTRLILLSRMPSSA